MTSISPTPEFSPVNANTMWSTALDMPFSPLKSFTTGAEEGAQSSFGLGTAFRGATTPAGNEMPPPPAGNPLADAINAPAAIRAGVEGIGRWLTGEQNPGLSKQDYEASPYFRTAVPWDPGMTEDRAAALASSYDIQTAKSYFGAKSIVPYMIGNFVGQAADPINYIPVFGEAAQAAAVAKFGVNAVARFGIRAGFGAAEAAGNTGLFGALTAEQRAKYGDDVSWQAQINNIAMAALIGGVVTPAMHGVAAAFGLGGMRAEDSVQSKVETVPNVGTARAVMNDAVTGLATDGEVKLSPSSADALTRLSADVVDKRDSSLALTRETQALNDLAGTDVKAGKVVITPSGARVQVRPEVVDLATLTAASGDLQVRDRSRAASAAQVEDIGRNLDPARLMPSIEADRGAPIVGPDNVVDSGNGRVAGIQRAYEAYPQQAAAYRQAIEDAGYSTEGMAQPVLVNRRVTPLSQEARAQFNAEANQPATARMSATELAAMDRGALDDQTLRQLADGPVTSAENKPFVQRFLGNLPGNDRAALVDKGGNLNADGRRRVENALVASAYGDVDAGVVARFSEGTDDNTRSIVGAMSDIAGKWALMRRAIKAGELSPEFDVTPELTSGLSKLSRWRDQAGRENRPVSTVIKEGMGQLDMLDGEMSLEAKTLIRMFFKTDEFKQGAGRDAIAARLGKIVDAANDLGRPQLFGDAEAATKLGVLEHAIDHSEADLFAAADAGTGTDGFRQSRGQRSPGADRGNAAEGAGVDQGGGPERSGPDAAGLEPALPFARQAATDMSLPRPDVVPDGLREAAGRVGTGEDIRALAAQHGVSEDGSFPEQADIDQMREAGQLTAEDEKLLNAADENAKEADLYGKSLMAAANCVARSL